MMPTSGQFDRDDYLRRDYEREQGSLRTAERYRFRELTEAELLKPAEKPEDDDIPFDFQK